MSIHLNVYRQEVCLNFNISLYIKKNECICHRGGTNKYFEFPQGFLPQDPVFKGQIMLSNRKIAIQWISINITYCTDRDLSGG